MRRYAPVHARPRHPDRGLVPPRAPRALDFEGCVNFRDLGGYRTADGLEVGWRRLFRADGLHRLTEADRRQLIDLGVATVIDLRTVDEAVQRGGSRWPRYRSATSTCP